MYIHYISKKQNIGSEWLSVHIWCKSGWGACPNLCIIWNELHLEQPAAGSEDLELADDEVLQFLAKICGTTWGVNIMATPQKGHKAGHAGEP